MDTRIQIVAIAAAGGLLLFVFELLRRRALQERYALIWLASGAVLLGLAIWQGLLENLADLLGIAYPPNALFLVAFGFVLVLLLHFSLAISRLTEETKILGQEVARLDERLREREQAPEEGPEQAEAAPYPHEPVAPSASRGAER
jgi:hypothetical protein